MGPKRPLQKAASPLFFIKGHVFWCGGLKQNNHSWCGSLRVNSLISWLLWKIRFNMRETISISHLCPRPSHLDSSDPKLCLLSCYCTWIYTGSLYEIRLLSPRILLLWQHKTISVLLFSPFENLLSFGSIWREFMICKTKVVL